ncbi:hypothetical protein A4D02_23570 [Niastella koreensis]|uniref:PDZ domain-containing protein n=1 Tax=Niastella koreensis TaxID=354356 RepID=A0ABX3P095_9BACT|nr:trypsin-like peptidase domain-containing protein [Niastella koreensis]OQP52179.1 hypothetical protein A4D02_23570 [Niastella koreensis]
MILAPRSSDQIQGLPAITIGNSDSLHLGQWVLAVGYPLNLNVTVTHGIVSAKSRDIGVNQAATSPVDAFIQTDAAVNPGSSGGALVNTNGELVGISAAIISPTGAYAGYAYAITSNLMKKVVVDIIQFGSVQRGYLGINMAPPDLDSTRKKALGINDDIAAVWVLDVDPYGAAAQSGIQKGDGLIRINGIPVSTNSEASELIARQKPGDTISVTYLRGRAENTARVVLKKK